MSVKRLTWHLEILERAKKNLLKEQYQAVRTRLDLAITICKEMLMFVIIDSSRLKWIHQGIISTV